MTSETNTYFPSHSKSSAIYISCVVILAAALVSLPFIQIEISVSTPALIRPSSLVSTIRNVQPGRIKESHLYENKSVRKGDLLYVIDSEALAEQVAHCQEKIDSKEIFIRDAQLAVTSSNQSKNTIELSHATTKMPSFQTPYYLQDYSSFLQEMSEAHTHYQKVKKDYDRQHKLFLEHVIAPAEFESFQFELQKAEDTKSQIIESSRSHWESELKVLREEKHELQSQLMRAEEEKAALSVRSPVTGTIQNLEGIYPGTMVYSNQELGQISPDTSLTAIAYVPPNDIGLIRKGMKVLLQVDAFNHNQWGMVPGTTIELAQDVKVTNNKAVFEVRCSMDRDYLQLKNGYKGFLRKGMTMRAHFLVAQRSVWQLLYDKLDDWMNPNL